MPRRKRSLTPRRPRRLPAALRAQRSVIADSFAVLRCLMHQLSERRFLIRLVTAGVAATLGVIVLWRLTGHGGSGRPLANRWAMTSLRQLAMLASQFTAAWWLTEKWSSFEPPRIRDVRGPLGRRVPELALISMVSAWLDISGSISSAGALLKLGGSLLLSYAIYYIVPAAAVYGTTLGGAVITSYRAWRDTFKTDLMAWSALWALSAVSAVIGQIPDVLDLYESGPNGAHLSSVGRLTTIFLVAPATLVVEAVGAAFVAVILYALRYATPPPGLPTSAVETVSGLHLTDTPDVITAT